MQLTMTKVQILGTQTHLNRTLASLQRSGVIQIEDATVGTIGLSRLPRAPHVEIQREELTFLLVKLDGLLSSLPEVPVTVDLAAYEDLGAWSFDDLLAEIRAGVEEVANQTRDLVARREALSAEQLSLPRYEITIRQLMPLAADIPQLERFETVALLIDRRFEEVLALIRRELADITREQFEIVSAVVDPDTVAAILVFPGEHLAEVNSMLGREHITQVRLPEELAGIPLSRALAAIRSRLDHIPAEIAEIDRQLAALSDVWYTRLVLWRAALRDRLAALNVRHRLGATEYTFVIVGWVPAERLDQVRQALYEEVGEEVIVTELPLTHEERENAPVVLANPAVIRPFETLIRLLALPRYGAVDPTPLMALFMPLFFGMILGDIAYGIVVVALGLWLRRRYTGTIRDLGSVLAMGGAWSVIFGFLYGEFLGTYGEALGLHPVLDRAHALEPLFATAVAMGVIQVVLGLILGAWEALRERHLGELSEKVGSLIALMAIFALLALAAGRVPKGLFTPIIVVLIIGVVLLSAPMGLIGVLLGPLEVLGTVGNILSYLRIAAIGLSSVYLAEVANHMAGLLGNVVLGIVVAGLFHVLNIALGIISPTIQSLRLHYVEFFSKFYQGGGRPFEPFRREMTDA